MKTKKILLTLIFAVIMQFAFGQILVDTNKVWSFIEFHNAYGLPPDTVIWGSYFTKFNKDTVIGEHIYKTVMKSFDSTQTTWKNIGFIREDTNKRVYSITNDSTEKILYDFNLNVGDTTTVFTFKDSLYNSIPIHIEVIYIDTVLINGETRKRWVTDNWYDDCGFHSDTIIEGIGSNSGLLLYTGYYLNGCYRSRELLCFSENDTLKYQNLVYNKCYVTSEVGVDIQERQKNIIGVKIFPNPVTNVSILNIENQSQFNGNNYTIEIFNILGEKIKKFNINKTKNQIEIKRNDFSSGLYIYKIKNNEDKRITTGKFIVN